MSESSTPSDAALKYPRGVSPRSSARRPVRMIEWVTLLHVGVLLVGTTWAFGGQADWVRTPLAAWGTLGVFITLAALRDRAGWREGWLRPLRWTWPIVAFNALVLLGCLNAGFREIQLGGETALLNEQRSPFWPSVAVPSLALHALWLFDAIWISCFNLALVIRRRRALRGLLLLAVLNALVLAIFGTGQRLLGSPGLYFGAIPTRQKSFFASFVYHNHWGAFALLMLAACLGLMWHYARRRESRDMFHSPAFSGVVVLLLITLTIPLSTSRSSTILAIVLLGAAFLHWTARLVQKRRHFKESIVPPIGVAAAAIVFGLAGIWFIARDTITSRVAKTREQIETMRTAGSVGARGILYRDTLRMGRDRPWFGWGMASYPHVFTLYNTQRSPDRLQVFYHDAHNDWLQAFAEHGVVGSALLALAAVLPLLQLRRRHFEASLTAYLLGGCGLILLYAWLEFPFGNVAVVLTWWLCFFAAVQYGRLCARGADRATSGAGAANSGTP